MLSSPCTRRLSVETFRNPARINICILTDINARSPSASSLGSKPVISATNWLQSLVPAGVDLIESLKTDITQAKRNGFEGSFARFARSRYGPAELVEYRSDINLTK